MQFSKGKPLILDVKSQKKTAGGIFGFPPLGSVRWGGGFPPCLSQMGGFLAKSCSPPPICRGVDNVPKSEIFEIRLRENPRKKILKKYS